MSTIENLNSRELLQHMALSTWPAVQNLMDKVTERGGGIAVYENSELGHPDAGHVQLASFGHPDAMLETDDPPTTLPDIGGAINWRYQLKGVWRP